MYTSNSPSFFKEYLGKEIDMVYTEQHKRTKHMLVEKERKDF